jgi:hypothetical protein
MSWVPRKQWCLGHREIKRSLTVGDLWIGLRHLEDVKSVVGGSVIAIKALCAMAVE